MDYAGFNETTAIRDECPWCQKWTNAWVTFAHSPLQAELIDLYQFKSRIEIKQDEAVESDAAKFFVDLMIKVKTSLW